MLTVAIKHQLRNVRKVELRAKIIGVSQAKGADLKMEEYLY